MATELEGRLQDLFNSFYNLYGRNFRKFVDLFLRAYERNVKWLNNIDRSLFEDLADIMDMLRLANRSTLHEMRAFLEGIKSHYSYAYFVDCLGLPELYALWHKAVDLGLVPILRAYINIEADTAAFKREFGAKTTAEVASLFKGFALRRLDTRLHELLGKPKTFEKLRDEILSRMEYVVASLPIGREDIIVFTDHGYDVFRTNSMYYAKHVHERDAAFSKLASVLILKKVK